MLITESKIRQIIAEELETLLEEEGLDEGWRDYIPSRKNLAALGLGAALAGGGVAAYNAGVGTGEEGYGARNAWITSQLSAGEEDTDKDRPKPKKRDNQTTQSSSGFRKSIKAAKKAGSFDETQQKILDAKFTDPVQSLLFKVYNTNKTNPNINKFIDDALKFKDSKAPNRRAITSIYDNYSVSDVDKLKLSRDNQKFLKQLMNKYNVGDTSGWFEKLEE